MNGRAHASTPQRIIDRSSFSGRLLAGLFAAGCSGCEVASAVVLGVKPEAYSVAALHSRPQCGALRRRAMTASSALVICQRWSRPSVGLVRANRAPHNEQVPAGTERRRADEQPGVRARRLSVGQRNDLLAQDAYSSRQHGMAARRHGMAPGRHGMAVAAAWDGGRGGMGWRRGGTGWRRGGMGWRPRRHGMAPRRHGMAPRRHGMAATAAWDGAAAAWDGGAAAWDGGAAASSGDCAAWDGAAVAQGGARGAQPPALERGVGRRARWSDAVLDAARTRTDPNTDNVVRALLDAGAVARADQLFALLLRSDDPIPPGMPTAAQAARS
jgi:hypothetical protein